VKVEFNTNGSRQGLCPYGTEFHPFHAEGIRQSTTVLEEVAAGGAAPMAAVSSSAGKSEAGALPH
jgi:hypothetical protein